MFCRAYSACTYQSDICFLCNNMTQLTHALLEILYNSQIIPIWTVVSHLIFVQLMVCTYVEYFLLVL